MRMTDVGYVRCAAAWMTCLLFGGMIAGCSYLPKIARPDAPEKVEQEPSFLYQKAQRLFDSGQLEAAISVWENIPPTDAKYVDAQMAIRSARLQIMQTAKQGASSFEADTQLDSLLQQAEAAEQNGQLREALSLYDEAMRLEPQNGMLQQKVEELSSLVDDALERHKRLGELYLSRGEYEKAKTEWEQALLIESDNAVAQQKLADLNVLLTASDKVFAQRGRSLLQKGLIMEAKAEFQKALRVNPNNQQSRSSLANIEKIAFTEHQVTKGETLASIAKKYTKKAADASILADFNGLPRDAALEIGQTINIPHVLGFKTALAPETTDALVEPEEVEAPEAAAGDVREIVPVSQQERAQSLKDAFQKGVAAYEAGNYRDAMTLFNQVYQADTEKIEAYNYFLRAMTKLQGGGDAAEESAPPEQAAPPQSPAQEAAQEIDVLLITANSHREMGDLKKAISIYEQALQLDPGNPEITKDLSDTQEELKKLITTHLNEGIKLFNQEAINEAIVEWDAALALDPQNQQALDYKKRAQNMLKALESTPTTEAPAPTDAPE